MLACLLLSALCSYKHGLTNETSLLINNLDCPFENAPDQFRDSVNSIRSDALLKDIKPYLTEPEATSTQLSDRHLCRFDG